MAEMVDGDDDGAARAKRARPERVTGFEDGSLTDAQEAHIEALIAAVQNGTPMPGRGAERRCFEIHGIAEMLRDPRNIRVAAAASPRPTHGTTAAASPATTPHGTAAATIGRHVASRRSPNDAGRPRRSAGRTSPRASGSTRRRSSKR